MPGTGNPLGNSEPDLPSPPAPRAACWQKVWPSHQLLHPFRGDPYPGGDCIPGKFQQHFQAPEMGTERPNVGTSLMNSVEQIKELEPRKERRGLPHPDQRPGLAWSSPFWKGAAQRVDPQLHGDPLLLRSPHLQGRATQVWLFTPPRTGSHSLSCSPRRLASHLPVGSLLTSLLPVSHSQWTAAPQRRTLPRDAKTLVLSGECMLLGFCLITAKIWGDGHESPLGVSQLSGLGQTML